jgi:hypothetical protein
MMELHDGTHSINNHATLHNVCCPFLTWPNHDHMHAGMFRHPEAAELQEPNHNHPYTLSSPHLGRS